MVETVRLTRLKLQFERIIPFYKSVIGTSQVSISVILAGIITILVTPVLTGIYSPSSFGQYSTAVAIATLFGTLFGHSRSSIVQLCSEQEVERLVSDAIAIRWTKALQVLLVTAVACLFGFGVAYGMIIGVLSVIVYVVNICRAFSARQLNFKRLARANISESISQNTGQMFLPLIEMTTLGLPFGFLIGKLFVLGQVKPAIGKEKKLKGPKKSLGKWRSEGFSLTAAALLNQITVAGIAIVITGLYGLKEAGIFAVALRLSSLPATFVGRSFNQLFFSKYAGWKRNDVDRFIRVRMSVYILFTLSILVHLVLVLIALPAVGQFLTGEWMTTSAVATTLTIWFAPNLVAGALSGAAIAERRSKTLLLLSCYEVPLRIGALVVGWRNEDFILGVELYALAGLVIALISLRFTLSTLDGRRISLMVPMIVLVGYLVVVVQVAKPAHLHANENWSRVPAVILVLLGLTVLARLAWRDSRVLSQQLVTTLK